MVLYFYMHILFQVYEMVNNSNSEIIHTDNLQPGYKYSFIVKLDLSLRSTSSDLCPYHQKCLVEGKRDILLRAWQKRKETNIIEHFLCVRHLGRHKCYLISNLILAVLPFYIWRKRRDFMRFSNLPKVSYMVRDGMRYVSKQPIGCGKIKLLTFSWSHFWDYHCESLQSLHFYNFLWFLDLLSL